MTNDWAYPVSCPSDSIECTNQDKRTPFGWFLVCMILLVFTLPTLLDGLFLYYYSMVSTSFKRSSTGLLLIFVSCITMVASVVYLYANCLSNAALLKDSVAILFLNDLDEYVFSIVERLKPSWVERLEEDIKNFDSIPSFIERFETALNHSNNIEISSCVQSNENEEDRNLVQHESVVNINSNTSRVEATSAWKNDYSRPDEINTSADTSLLFSHIGNLNEQIRELHRIIEDLRRSEEHKNIEIREEFRAEIKFIKNNICV